MAASVQEELLDQYLELRKMIMELSAQQTVVEHMTITIMSSIIADNFEPQRVVKASKDLAIERTRNIKLGDVKISELSDTDLFEQAARIREVTADIWTKVETEVKSRTEALRPASAD